MVLIGLQILPRDMLQMRGVGICVRISRNKGIIFLIALIKRNLLIWKNQTIRGSCTLCSRGIHSITTCAVFIYLFLSLVYTHINGPGLVLLIQLLYTRLKHHRILLFIFFCIALQCNEDSMRRSWNPRQHLFAKE